MTQFFSIVRLEADLWLVVWILAQSRLPPWASFSVILIHTAGGCGEKLQRRSKIRCCVTSPQPLAFCAPWSKFMYSSLPPTLSDHRWETVGLIASTRWIEPAIRTLGEVMGLIVTGCFSHGPGLLHWPPSPPAWRNLRNATLICAQWALEFSQRHTQRLHLCGSHFCTSRQPSHLLFAPPFPYYL